MKYLSVCSGIEAATQAWHSLGWEPVAFSEIEKFPSAVLAHHYPNVPNWGDMTKFKEWPDATVDVLVGGTPCQSFSVAGLRKGLADLRGSLALTYLAIANRYRPSWMVFENVPGLLSADGGKAFGSLLGGMAELGYGFAYRILDAQYVRTQRFPHAVPQRRRRVFVVAHLGDWRRAAAVLFDRESLRGNPPPRREAGEGVAPSLAVGSGGSCGHQYRQKGSESALIPECANPLTHRMHKGINSTLDEGQTPLPVLSSGQANAELCDNLSPALKCNRDGSPIVGQPIAFHNRQDPDISGDVTHPLGSMDNGMAVAFAENSRAEVRLVGGDGGVSAQLTTGVGKPGQGQPCITQAMAVRRLTVEECEALQGFPRGFTRIPWRNKPAEQCPDGPRYKALGNSFAVNVVEWLGQRIEMVDKL